MSINERFEKIIADLFKGNKSAFAKSLGVAPTVIQNVVGTKTGNPSYNLLVKVCSSTNVSPTWLLTGEGDMLRPTATTSFGDNVTSGNVLSSVDNRQGTFYEPCREELVHIRELESDNAHLVEQNAHLKDFIQNLKERIAEKDERIVELKARIAELKK